MNAMDPPKALPSTSDMLEVAAASPATLDLEDSSLYFNRELSWLDFNDRVLQLAEDQSLPLLERVKFCAIWESNLDEFFMVRVANLHDQIAAGMDARGADGVSPSRQIDEIRARVLAQRERLARCFEREARPSLAERGFRIISPQQATPAEREELDRKFRMSIFPALTPLAIGLGRPFPYISNLSLSLAVTVRDPDPGMEVIDRSFFRVTRDTDYDVSDEADDLLQAVEEELRRRRFGEVVRLEVDPSISATLREQLRDALGIDDRRLYEADGLLDLADLWDVVGVRGFGELREPAQVAVTQPRLLGEKAEEVNIFGAIREGDILVHHPYDSFATSVERFVEQAVADPNVLAIKQTVYRTSDDSSLVPALIEAAELGKQAVCLVELKARFDERANIQWARA